MKYLNIPSQPFVRAKVSGNEVLIYTTSYDYCPCCGRISHIGSESLFRTISLTQYKDMIEHDSLTL